jgi:DNA-binding LacI/PurR family transcriptional regulator
MWVDVDHEQSAYAAAKLLFQLGHRRLMIVDGKSDRMQLYLAGARQAVAHFGAQRHGSLTIELEPLCRAWETTHERPTAFFCPNVALARDIAAQASENRIIVGRDISTIAYDENGKEGRETRDPSLTVCRHNIEMLARRTLEAFVV